MAVIDAPDIDSVDRNNRELADLLVEACDLCVFVTTATRYADLVPWEVLRRVRERGLPLVVGMMQYEHGSAQPVCTRSVNAVRPATPGSIAAPHGPSP